MVATTAVSFPECLSGNPAGNAINCCTRPATKHNTAVATEVAPAESEHMIKREREREREWVFWSRTKLRGRQGVGDSQIVMNGYGM